jgi:WD40 repeat protein/serine/threonine protein kinase
MAGSNDGKEAPDSHNRALEETLEAPSRKPPTGADLDHGVPLADRDGRRRLIESPERDHPDLVAVDPDHYVLGYELARGGMGRIVTARDRRLGRVVAVKELLHDTPDRAARFEREALITARLQHPAIVNIHEAGRWPSGQPFYAMKLVAGRSLSEVASETKPLAERLALLPNLIAMVEAVAFAHRQRIIHRDLKPSNVLIGDLGETVVIDWGLAKDLAAEPGDRTHLPGGTDDTVDAREGDNDSGRQARRPGTSHGSSGSLTVAGSVMGTPGYMPPEQAAGNDVDERADVYALGGILYHLLGGAEPYGGASAEAILAAVLAGPPETLARVEPGLAQDLVTIIEKAMAREADGRYRTALQLAEDLRRFQTGKLVGAHRYSRRELVWRFLVRHRAAVVATLAALITIAAVATVSFRRVIAERDRAEAASVAAARRADELAVARAASLVNEDPRAALELLARLSPAAPPTTWRTARMVASEVRLRGIPDLLRGHRDPVVWFDLSADGKLLVSADLHEVRAWDLTRGTSRVLGRQEAVIQRIALSPTGRHVVTSGVDGRLRLWSLDTSMVTELGSHDGLVLQLHFLPDGERLISAGFDGAVRLWRLSGRDHELVGSHNGRVSDVDLSEDGETVASVGEDRALRVWQLGRRSPVREFRLESPANRIALAPDGSRVAAAGSENLWLWQMATGEVRRLIGHDKDVLALEFSSDGRKLASAGGDRTIRLWDVATGEAEVLRDHGDEVYQLRFARDQGLLLSAGRDGTVRVWMLDEKSASAVQVMGGHDPNLFFDLSDDAGVVVSSAGTDMRRWPIGTGSRPLRGHRGQVSQVAFAPDGRIVSAGHDWSVRVWPAGRGGSRELRGHESIITSLAVSPDGRFAASIDAHLFIWLWDLEAGVGRRLSGRAYGEPRFSMDGGVVAAPSVNNEVRLWSTATGESRVVRGHSGWVTAVAFSPDGRSLASAAADKTVRLWDLASGAGRVFKGHRFAVRYVEFAGAASLVSSDLAGSTREWDLQRGNGREIGSGPSGVMALAAAQSGELVAWADLYGKPTLWRRRSGRSQALSPRGAPIRQLLFSADGRTLLGRDTSNQVILWDTATDAVQVLPGHGREISDVAFSSRGDAVATADSDRTVRIWPCDLPYQPDALRAWLVRMLGPAPATRRR